MAVELPEDVYLTIFTYLDFRDILRMRQTCRKYSELTRLRGLWRDLLRTHVLEEDIPIPGLRNRSFDELEIEELEQYASKALRLRRNWISESPKPTMTTTVTTEVGGRIIYLEFLRRPEHQWLLSLSLITTGNIRRFILQCWDLDVEGGTCIARQEYQNLQSLVVNKDPAADAIIAIQAPHITVYTINAHANNADTGFIPMAVFPEITNRLYLLSGTRLLTREHQDRYRLWDISQPWCTFELTNPELHEYRTVLGAVVDEEYVVLVRPMTLELYALPETNQSIVLEPLVTYNWRWRIDSVAILRRFQWARQRTNLNMSITILIRFGSLFPWPINLLHHYELHPDMFFDPSFIVDEDNMPYQFPPTLRQTIASPIRLFAPTDMTFGPYGTALWIDSHTEDVFGHADRGQRIAARFTPPNLVQDDEAKEEAGEVILSDQEATTMAASVIACNERDTWVKLGMNEEEGKVAVGSVDGTITIFDFI